MQEHVDPSLDPSSVPDPVLAVLADVALICLAEEPSQRPTMKDVVRFLEPASAYKGEGGGAHATHPAELSAQPERGCLGLEGRL